MTMLDFCELSLDEYQYRVKGFLMAEAKAWDRTRHIMYTQILCAGGKTKAKSPKDILKIPLIDGAGMTSTEKLVNQHYLLKAHLMAEQLRNGGTG